MNKGAPNEGNGDKCYFGYSTVEPPQEGRGGNADNHNYKDQSDDEDSRAGWRRSQPQSSARITMRLLTNCSGTMRSMDIHSTLDGTPAGNNTNVAYRSRRGGQGEGEAVYYTHQQQRHRSRETAAFREEEEEEEEEESMRPTQRTASNDEDNGDDGAAEESNRKLEERRLLVAIENTLFPAADQAMDNSTHSSEGDSSLSLREILASFFRTPRSTFEFGEKVSQLVVDDEGKRFSSSSSSSSSSLSSSRGKKIKRSKKRGREEMTEGVVSSTSSSSSPPAFSLILNSTNILSKLSIYLHRLSVNNNNNNNNKENTSKRHTTRDDDDDDDDDDDGKRKKEEEEQHDPFALRRLPFAPFLTKIGFEAPSSTLYDGESEGSSSLRDGYSNDDDDDDDDDGGDGDKRARDEDSAALTTVGPHRYISETFISSDGAAAVKKALGISEDVNGNTFS
eukprot:jgi/Bigna1/125539/aug1.1_g247